MTNKACIFEYRGYIFSLFFGLLMVICNFMLFILLFLSLQFIFARTLHMLRPWNRLLLCGSNDFFCLNLVAEYICAYNICQEVASNFFLVHRSGRCAEDGLMLFQV